MLIGLVLLSAAAWAGGAALLRSTGPSSSEPISANQITVTPTAGAVRP